MKRLLILAALAFACIIAASGCKKQNVMQADITPVDTVSHDPVVYPDPTYSSTGLLIGKVMPETKFTMLLYNDQYSYTDFTIANRTGTFMMKDIKAGNYTLYIEPADPNLSPIELTKITIDSSRTTNLGLIFLP